MTQAAPVEIAQLIPVWAVVVLIWFNGAMATAIGAMVLRILGGRSVDAQITGAKTSVVEIMATKERSWNQAEISQNNRLDVLERELFGLDGENGVRGNVKVTRRDVGMIAIVLRRLAESSGIDAKELDFLNGE
jgi:hypothetical protein